MVFLNSSNICSVLFWTALVLNCSCILFWNEVCICASCSLVSACFALQDALEDLRQSISKQAEESKLALLANKVSQLIEDASVRQAQANNTQ